MRPGGGRPALNFLHIALPHRPWEYLPDGTQYRAVRAGRRRESCFSAIPPRPARCCSNMLQGAYSDRLLGRLLDRLRRLGIYDRALVVVAADHGISFRPGGQLRLAKARTSARLPACP